jgi:DNA-binding transcriptional ArsR family regulator
MHAGIDDFHVPDDEVIDQACDILRILSDPTRMRLLYALSQGESNVACLAEIVGANPTAVSQHLSKLRLAGIVKARRQGTYMYYTVVDPTIDDVLNTLLGQLRPKTGEAAPERVEATVAVPA